MDEMFMKAQMPYMAEAVIEDGLPKGEELQIEDKPNYLELARDEVREEIERGAEAYEEVAENVGNNKTLLYLGGAFLLGALLFRK